MTRMAQTQLLVAITGLLVFGVAALFGGVERSAPSPTVPSASEPAAPAGVPGAAIGVGEGSGVAASEPAPPPSAPDGRMLFRSLECTRCHAAEGVGRARGALDGVGARLDAAAIRQWIVAPQSVDPWVRKPPYDDLDDREVDALVEYLLSLADPG